MSRRLAMTILIYFSIFANLLLLPTGMIAFRDFGVDHRIIQHFVENQQTGEVSEKALGSEKNEKQNGGQEITYYSITTNEEEAEHRKEEKEKVERSWEMLKNIIIDNRRR
jgi:hypothetical protein